MEYLLLSQTQYADGEILLTKYFMGGKNCMKRYNYVLASEEIQVKNAVL